MLQSGSEPPSQEQKGPAMKATTIGRALPLPAARRSRQIRGSSLPLVLQAPALSFLGRCDEARAAARRAPELEPGFTISGFVRAHTGRAEIWQPIGDALRRLGLPE